MSDTKSYHFNETSLLITVYNRSSSLKRLLIAFQQLGISFHEIIVSDDGSKPEHIASLNILKDQYGFKLITAPKNKGLGNNINKGQDAVTAKYTLYVQEDFVPLELFGEKLEKSLKIIKADPEIDIIRYYAYFPYPYTKKYDEDFSETIFKSSWLKWNHLKFYFYSDHPHLRKSNIFEKFGRYTENLDVNKTEFNMSLSFIKHNARGLFYNKYTELFDQRNSEDEPSTANRSDWRQKKNPAILALRKFYLVYRYIKNNLQLNALKAKTENIT